MWLGIFLICLGLLYLMDNLHIISIDIWDAALPILIICVGLAVISRSGIFGKRRNR